MQFKTKHLISGAEFSATEILTLLECAKSVKQNRLLYPHHLQNKHVALIFEKPSLRTRSSFTVAVHELGGQVFESNNLTRKKEEPEDLIGVLQGYCHALMMRTYEESFLERMIAVSKIPIISGLTDNYHPCQTFADLLTLQECFPSESQLKITYIGDGNNILHSLLIMASKLGIAVNYCCPDGHTPKDFVLDILKQNGTAHLCQRIETPQAAVKGVHAIYTDVWTSMGFAEQDLSAFAGYQVDEALFQYAHPNARFMHCMPINRGEEVSEELPNSPRSVIYQQSENRLHVQKALLLGLIT